MEPKRPLSKSQESAISPYPEPDESNVSRLTLFL
jgi:hypothetical protein